ncbi:MAG TPA: hypothetical protein VN667_09225 [Burkholderiales bacterium]|nr:hypothetical protein [Burkholderiales bacterium]
MTMSLKLYRLLGQKGLPRNQAPVLPKLSTPPAAPKPKTRARQEPAPFGISYRIDEGGFVFIQPVGRVPG